MKKICPQCNFMLDEDVINCPQCNYHFRTKEEMQNERMDQAVQNFLWSELKEHAQGGNINAWPKKNRIIAAALAIFLGGLAVDDFYLGRDLGTIGTHLILSFITGGAIGVVWGIIRGIMYLTCDKKTFQNKYRVRL